MINEDKMINKNKIINEKGGKVIASGGYGCVFSPALKCEGESKRPKGKISKLMTERRATEEYEEIQSIKEKLDTIKNYKDYYLLYDATLCKPSKLTASDLADYASKCTALPKDDVTKTNINSNLDKLMALNMPNGGLPVDDYLYENGSFEKIYKLHTTLVELLKKGIIPMNEKNIYHCDIKDSNVLVDASTRLKEVEVLKTRLIDWGLSTQYVPFKKNSFPKSWRNRPLQFNVPFSVIIFSDTFVSKYTQFIKDGGSPEEAQLKPFIIDYVSLWMKERGAGHYKFINEIMFMLFSNSLTSISPGSKPQVIETQITMDFIVNYIVDVLVHFTKFREDGTLDLRDYLDNVFIKIVDIWGFINVYVPLIELLSNNYASLTKNELKIFNQIQFIFVEYLYNPRHEPIDMKMLYSDLKDLGNLLHIKIKGKKKTSSISTKSLSSLGKAAGIHSKTRRNANKYGEKTSISFKRKPKQKRFKNPFFLSLNKK
jgi:serine/threonine protein kinase